MPIGVIAAGVGAVGAIGGALISSSGQKSAANTAAAAQQQGTNAQLQLGQQNIAFQQGIYDKNTALLNPFVQRGNTAGNSINALLGLGGTPAAAAPAAAIPANAAAQGYQTASPYTQQPIDEVGYDQNTISGRPLPYKPYMGPQGTQNTLAQQPATNPVAATTPAATPAQTPAQAANDAFNTFAHSAGIDFQQQQSANALNNLYAAHGQIQSGAAMKGISDRAQQIGLNNYFLPYLGLLQGQQATGAQSGAAIAGVGSNFGNTVSNIYGQQSNAIQNGADATSNAALLRGQASANFGNTVGSALGTFGSSFFQPSSPYAAPASSGGYNLGGGTANYFAQHPFGGSY